MILLKKPDNIEYMGNKTRNVRYPEWIKQAVADFTKKNAFENESKTFIWLLSTQLNRYGYYEENYTKGMADSPLTDDIQDSKVSHNDLNLEIRILQRKILDQMEVMTDEQIQQLKESSSQYLKSAHQNNEFELGSLKKILSVCGAILTPEQKQQQLQPKPLILSINSTTKKRFQVEDFYKIFGVDTDKKEENPIHKKNRA